MRFRRLFRKSLIFLLGYVALSCAAGILVAEGTLHPGRRLLLPGDEIRAQSIAERYDADLADITISAPDGIALRGWSFRPHSRSGKVVVLLHGLSDNRLGMVGYVDMFLQRGFAVLLPDARAHGASGGQVATYGLLEAADIHAWYRWLEDNQHPTCVFALCESMGAAELLASLDAKSDLCAVAAESPFSSFREIAYDRVGQFFHVGPWLGRSLLRPIVDAAFLYARWRYQLNFERLSPAKRVASSKVPVLLIHGRMDTNIPIRHSRQIAADSKVAFWEVPNVQHCGAMSTVPQEFQERVLGWFAIHAGHQRPGRKAPLPSIRRVVGRW